MSEIHNRKLQQSTYLRQIQQDKSARKRELMAQQQQDLISMRQYYADENKKIDEESADAVNHIREETAEMSRQYTEEQRQAKENVRIEQEEQRQTQHEAARENSASQASEKNNGENRTVYNRQGQKKTLLQNYQTKETDDFYKVQNRGSRISENNREYVIEAYAPEHEKDNLKVSVQRNKAVISGQRKFGDSAQEGNKKMSTHNFQTFREEFKFNRPVSQDGMTRERVGDFVRFTIPKLEAVNEIDPTEK